MGDVYLRRGDLTGSAHGLRACLGVEWQRTYSAMAGAADVRWRSGDRANAVSLYRRIIERVGDGPGYGQTAASRIKEFEGAKASEPSGDQARSNGEPSRNAP
ncbi:MAG: hypothetical protein QM784_07570 [Polyangiaceae bacterium]